MTREELFTNLKGGARWDVGVAINRSNSLPLDANSIFESYEAAEAYASKDASRIAEYGFLNNAYIGQIITVVPTEGDIGVYYIDANQKLQQVGKSITADEASIVNDNGTIKIYGFDAAAASTYPRKGADGKIEWVTIEQLVEGATENTITAGDNKTIDSTASDTGYTVSLHGAADASENQVPALDADKKLKWIDVYTKSEIDGKISGVLSYKGAAAGVPTDEGKNILVGDKTIAASADNIGHVYFYNGKEYASDGSKWEELGSATDLSAYYTSAQVDAAIDADVKVEADRAIAAEEALGNRITTLEEIDHSVYATKEEVSTLNTNLTKADTDLGARISTLETAINTETTGLSAKVTALEALTDSHSGSIETLNTELAKKLDTSVYEAYIEGKTYSDTQIDEKIAAVDADGLDTRIKALESTVGDAESGLVKDVADAKGDITTLKSDVAALKSADTTILERIGALESTDTTHTADISALKTSVADHTTALAGLSGTVKEVTDANAAAAAEAKSVADGAVLATQTNAANIASNSTAIEGVSGRVTTLESQISGLTGAMHFKGAVSSDPTASDFDKSSYAAGDVVIYGKKEYVLTVSDEDVKSFVELGDESSYALKDSVYTKSEVDSKIEAAFSWQNME